jgi:HEAT repeat protein
MVASKVSEDSALFQALANSLRVDDDVTVAAAIRVLGIAADPELAPVLLDACATRTVVSTGTQSVVAMGRAVIEPLLREFFRVGIESRVLFLEVIEQVGDGAVVPELLELARVPELRCAETAVRIVGRLGGVDSVPHLMHLAEHSGADLERQIGYALSAIALRHPKEVAEQVLATYDAGDLRPAWLMVLAALGDPGHASRVSLATRHSDTAVRCAAFESAVAFGAAFPLETVKMGLADESLEVRIAAARALGAFRNYEAVDALLAATRDPDSAVVAEALRSLGTLGGPKVVNTLLDAAGSPRAPVAIAALQSLFRLNPPRIGQALDRAARHADPEVVCEAIDASIRLPSAEAEVFLKRSLSHRHWTVRRAAAESLARRGFSLPGERLHELREGESDPLVVDALAAITVAEESGA